MAAYMKDVEGSQIDLTAQEILRNKHERKEVPTTVSKSLYSLRKLT